jgi:ribonucleoside-diphosphate reductase alpha chain
LDFKALNQTARLATRFLDNVIDANFYPIRKVAVVSKGNRKIGLGIMGFADTLFTLGIPYNSEHALEFADCVMAAVMGSSKTASMYLAKRRGAFPNWLDSMSETYRTPPRNACTTCIAPTGSISILAGCSAGIEPCFALAYVRKILGKNRILEVNPVFDVTARKRGFYTPRLMREIASRGSIQGMASLPADVRRLFVTAPDIEPLWHVKMAAAFQMHCDGAVSKTVIVPNTATPADVKAVYVAAFDNRCKGITVYRDGSRSNQPMDHDTAAPAPTGQRSCNCSECAVE